MHSSQPSAPPADPLPRPDRSPGRVLFAALACGAAAFALYRATLLPGVDFGDTGSLQTMVGDPLISPRDGYPLYFAIGSLVLAVTGAGPAHALNLASAVEAAIACGLFVPVATELAGSLAAGIAAAALFGVSYTFWSQAVIAEVYALHITFVLLTLLLLLRWARQPSLGRLTAFFLFYALGFGDHLSMILLAPGYTLFLLASAPSGWRSMFRPRVIGTAILCACAGALPYLWNIRTLWMMPQPPGTVRDALGRFWFDVTKSDWRDTMVWGVPRSMLRDHLAMYWFDLKQQFGLIGPLLAALGLFGLVVDRHAARNRGLLLFLLYLINVLFAFSYNVGDAHVFYLPSHLVLALLAAIGIAMAGRIFHSFLHSFLRVAAAVRVLPGVSSAVGSAVRGATPAIALVLAVYAGARAYHDLPALDRSGDRRPLEILDRLTSGLDDRHAIMLADLNWQIANGLSYYTKAIRPEVAVVTLPDVLLYAPVLIADNHAAGREVVATERARATLEASYGPLLPSARDERVPNLSLSEKVRGLPRGTRFVLCVLGPSGELGFNAADVGRALDLLTGGRSAPLPDEDYAAVAGIIGDPASLTVATRFPFRRVINLAGEEVEIRMESWLPADTIRRMGFGHVVAARRHTLIVERGVSFVAFDEDGRAIQTAYEGNVFAEQPRYLVLPDR